MLIKEYRVILPMTVDEYQVAQLFAVAELSKHETGGGDGVEVLVNDPFDSEKYPPVPALLNGDPKYTKGQYTHKKYYLYQKVPPIVRFVAPTSALILNEVAWNAYPYCRTILTNEYFQENFNIKIESFHSADLTLENAHQLSDAELASREVIVIDIGAYEPGDKDRTPEFDPTLFSSTKTGRGPLGPKWWLNYDGPVMCAYKLVRCHCKIPLVQGKLESMIQRQELRLFTHFHRQVFCMTDQWYGMTMEDVRRMEEETKRELEIQRAQGSLRGHKGEE